MPLFKSIENIFSSKLGLWLIEEDYQQLYDEVSALSFEIAQLDNFKNELKKCQWLASRLLINSMDKNVKRITYNENGAPFTSSGIYISLSHSKNMVAVILDNSIDVGIDIQVISPKIELIKKKFCTKNELDFVSKNETLQKLHLIWSVKESIYKQVKIPGIIFKEEMEIEPFELKEKGRINARVDKGESRVMMELEYEILGDFTLVYTLNT
jgi:4'-phosphopantetheinyl transferase EntD